jgi:GT2 family glycosyltransferase
MNPEISFITINYNSSKYTVKLLESIKKYTSLTYEVIIVDNNSSIDDLNYLEKYIPINEKVQVIKNKKNDGFATGNMIGSSYAHGKYLFFINNDTELLNDCSLIMAKYLDQNIDIALSTTKIVDQKGKFTSSYKLFPSVTKELLGNTIARKFSKYNFPSNKIELKAATLVEVVSGSCMFFRYKDFYKIGGFNTDLFLYCEEEDICKKVWNCGKQVVFLPNAYILHYSGGSTNKSFDIEKEYYISYNILLQTHFGYFSRKVLKLLQLIKLFRRSFKTKHGWKLFLYGIKGFKKEYSLKEKQKN